MKKITKSICLLLCVLLTLNMHSCVSKNQEKTNDNRTKLTLANFDDYLDVYGQFSPAAPRKLLGYTYYDETVASAEIYPTSQYLKFYDCIVKVKLTGYCEIYNENTKNDVFDKIKHEKVEVLNIKVNRGGTGYNEYVSTNNYDGKKGIGPGESVVIEKCEIMSVTGYVEEMNFQ